MMSRILTAAALIVMLMSQAASAVTVALTNPSFEDTGDTDYSSASFESDTGWNVTKHTVTAPAWSVGVYAAAGVYSSSLPDGVRVAYIFRDSATLWQPTSKTFEAGETYSITASIGQRSNFAVNPYAPSQIRLFAGTSLGTATLLKSVTVSPIPTPGEFDAQTLTFGPSDINYASLLAAEEGETLIVALFTDAATVSDSETDWDNILLSFTEAPTIPAPEPASLMLLAFGSILLLRRSPWCESSGKKGSV